MEEPPLDSAAMTTEAPAAVEGPCSSGGAEGSSRRAAARCATAAAIPLAASEMANSNRVKGASWTPQVAAVRSAARLHTTAAMLAGSIAIKVGRPQKRSHRGPGW